MQQLQVQTIAPRQCLPDFQADNPASQAGHGTRKQSLALPNTARCSSVKQPRKRQPKPISLDPPRQSGRLASQAKVNYQEDTFAEDRKILSRLSTTGFVMSSHKTPGKTVSEDMSLMDVFKKSPYYEAVDEPVLRLVQECMEAAK